MCSMLYYKGLMLTATNVSLEMNKDIKVERHIHGTTEREDDINRMPIEYEQTALYNPQSGFAAFLIPPVLMLIIQQTLLLGIGMSAGDSREKHLGSIRPFHKAYKNPVHIVAGKAMLYFLLYMMIGSYMFAFVTPACRLPQSGDYVTFIAFLVPYLLAFIFLAMVLSAFVYRARTASCCSSSSPSPCCSSQASRGPVPVCLHSGNTYRGCSPLRSA